MKKIILREDQLKKIKTFLKEEQISLFNLTDDMLNVPIEKSNSVEQFISNLERILSGISKSSKYRVTIYNTIEHLKSLDLKPEDRKILNEHFSDIINVLYRKHLKTNKGKLQFLTNILLKISEIGNFFKYLTDIIVSLRKHGYDQYKSNKLIEDIIKLSEKDDYIGIENKLNSIGVNPSKEYEDSFGNYGYNIQRTQPRLLKDNDIIKQFVLGDESLDDTCHNIITNINEYLYNDNNNNDKYDIIYDGDTLPDLNLDKGDKIEVKKLHLKSDSYLSEFFSIGKTSDWQKLFKENENYRLRYNSLIECLYNELSNGYSETGYKIIDSLIKNIKGIFFDDYVFVPKEYLEFYLTDKGMSSCHQLRLSVRFRVKPQYVFYKLDTTSLSYEKVEGEYSPKSYTYCTQEPTVIVNG
jgi:hypothetical protein